MISFDEYLALSNAVAPESDPRVAIQGILIEAGGVWVATNGHVMVTIDTEAPIEGLDAPIIARPWDLPMPRTKKERNAPITIEFAGEKIIARHGLYMTELELIDRTYPDWRGVSGWHSGKWKAGQIGYLGVNPKYLANLGTDIVKMEFGEVPGDLIRVSPGKPLLRARVTLIPVRV